MAVDAKVVISLILGYLECMIFTVPRMAKFGVCLQENRIILEMVP